MIQRKVLVGGTWYGKKDEAALQALKVPENLPAWSDVQLREDAFYVLKPDRSGWDEDTTLLFYRFKNVGGKSTRPGYAKVGASGRDPFADVGFGKTGQDRVNPKHLDRRTVSKARLFKYKTEIAGHWMLECEVRGGKDPHSVKYMKIDLTKDGYRIYYNVEKMQPTTMSDEISFDLDQPTPVGRVYEAFVVIAKGKGKWTGTHKYNCQDFALTMLQQLRVQQQQQANLTAAADWRRQQFDSLGGQPLDE